MLELMSEEISQNSRQQNATNFLRLCEPSYPTHLAPKILPLVCQYRTCPLILVINRHFFKKQKQNQKH